MSESKKHLKEPEKLLAVYYEFRQTHGDTHSKKELLLLAKEFIDFADGKYDKGLVKEWRERSYRASAHSMTTDIAIRDYPWAVAEIERKLYDREDDE